MSEEQSIGQLSDLTNLVQISAAALHKTVFSQLDSLIALGVTAPQDVSAISDWVAQHAEEGQARQVRQSLPSLPIGQAWVWSPEWLGVTQ